MSCRVQLPDHLLTAHPLRCGLLSLSPADSSFQAWGPIPLDRLSLAQRAPRASFAPRLTAHPQPVPQAHTVCQVVRIAGEGCFLTSLRISGATACIPCAAGRACPDPASNSSVACHFFSFPWAFMTPMQVPLVSIARVVLLLAWTARLDTVVLTGLIWARSVR